jgi:hypothetical protein
VQTCFEGHDRARILGESAFRMIFRIIPFCAVAIGFAVSAGFALAEDLNAPLPGELPPPTIKAPDVAKPAAPAAKAGPDAPNPPPAAASGVEPAPVPIPTAPVQMGMPAPNQTGVPPKPLKIVHPPPPRETALSSDPNPTLQPNTFFATAKASERYSAIADAGGWPTVPALKAGAKGPAVALLRQRLAAEGDLEAPKATGPDAEKWDQDLTAAVKRFQSRMGLRDSGNSPQAPNAWPA